jgi:chorismate-pyruvate lyase
LSSAALLTSRSAILSLHKKLLASASATAVLREVFGDPVEIIRIEGGEVSPTLSQCKALGVSDARNVAHRQVVLVAAGRRVSEADLWYVPSRLWSGMAQTLLCSTIPVGTVVAPMQPSRETLAARVCSPGERYALHHEAILRVAGEPIALVHEYYMRS